MRYAVVLELDGCPPQHLGDFVKLHDAETAALEMAVLHQHTGGKVTISTPDSADQLQRYSGDRFLRDQPDEAATGEDVTIHVPTAHQRVRELPA